MLIDHLERHVPNLLKIPHAVAFIRPILYIHQKLNGTLPTDP